MSDVAAKYKTSDRLQRGEVIASRYLIEQLWRNHPLGELYRCRDLTNGDLVTLQRLRREFAEPGVGDRIFETRGRAALGSPWIADILDYGADFDGRPFVVCRTWEAFTLAELERPLAFHEVLEIGERIATALMPAHAERLVHGGLDPASVMIERDPAGRPRVVALLGFGLVPALAGAANKGRSLPLVMSPFHVAPELIRGAPMSPAADVYALGILLWELIHGTPPFRGPTLRVLDAHQRLPLPARELPYDVPSSFDWVLRRMLAKNPVDRFADAATVVEQLRAFASEAIPDLTFELDPEPEQQRVVASLGEDDETDRTIIYRRRAPSRSEAAAIANEPTPVAFPRSRRAKAAAVATIALAGMLIVLQALAGTPAESARDATAPQVVTAAPVIDDTPPRVKAEPVVRAEAVPPPRAMPGTLAEPEFLVHERALLAEVERHCGEPPQSLDVGVRVGPSGKVDSITTFAGNEPDACIEAQLRQLEFPASERGGYHVYTLGR
jgi:serine/threonine protein kinase